MARPFRHQRPDLPDDLVVRPAVQQLLAQRFDRRVTSVVAGAGFGKTTALVQAFEENHLRPLGRDVWLACEPADTDPHHFAVGLGVALDLTDAPSPDDLVRQVNEWIGGQSPSQVCLVFDDTHLVEGSETPALLAALIESMPANGHVVLIGRRQLDVPLTRLELIGQCVTMGEDDLRLTDVDAAALLGSGATDEVTRFAGWPALIQLARRGRSTQFVLEEVVDLLSDDQRTVLRALVAIGEADGGLLDEITGLSAAALLQEIPLVHRRGDRWGAHDLWSELITVDDGPEIRRAAARALTDRDEPDRAVDLLLPLGRGRSDEHDEALAVALRNALLDPTLAGGSAMRRWAEQLRGSGWEHPAARFLDGIVVRLDNPGSTECHELLQHAADGFLEIGDHEATVAALSALCFAYHVRRDVAGLLSTFGQLQLLADAGVADARPFPLLGAGLVATAQGSPEEVLTQTEQLMTLEVSSEIRAITLWLHANALCNLGRDAVDTARECYEMGLPLPGMSMVYCNARLHAGLIEDLRNDPIEPVDGERDRFLLAAWETVVAALVDEVDEAKQHLAIVETSMANEAQWQTIGSVAIPQAIVAAAEFRDDDAAAILRGFVDVTPREGGGRFYYTASIGLLYPLLPELREWYDSLDGTDELGPNHQRDLRLAQALTAIIEGETATPAEAVELPSTIGELLASIGARLAAVLLAACTDVGRPEAPALVEAYVDLLAERARVQFRRAAESPITEVARGARAVLESIPVAPSVSMSVALLGGTDLIVDGRPVDHSDWRRERVRALLTYLVLNPDTTRESAIASLWPDADPASGRRNLRSTLNVLHAVLEPDRRGGDAPYFVRSVGQRLRLVLDDHMDVDVRRFESTLDTAVALDRGGTPSQSIEPYLAAVEIYRGDLLPDSYDDWVVFARDRLRGRYVSAGVRLAELLVMTERAGRAVDVATQMLSVEPWSEPAHRVLIAAHLAGGDVATARRCLATCDQSLADFGGASEPETDELRRRLAAR